MILPQINFNICLYFEILLKLKQNMYFKSENLFHSVFWKQVSSLNNNNNKLF